MRWWADACLAELAGWLDPAGAKLPSTGFAKLPTSFTAPLVTADLLLSAGESRLMHVEYESSPKPDLVQRMYEYRGRIMREYPKRRLTQHLLILATGVVRGFDD